MASSIAATTLGRIFGQERPRQLGDAAVVVEPVGRAGGEPLGQRGGRRVIRPARSWGKRHDPRSSLRLADGGLGHQRRQDVGCPFPSQVVEHLERLVGEVDGVAAVEEDVVGDRGEHEVGDRGGVQRGDGRWPACARRRRPIGSRRSAGTSRSSRSAGSAPPSGSSGKRGGRPRVSRETNARPWTSARPRSAGSRWGSTLAIAVSTVRPAPHPAWR